MVLDTDTISYYLRGSEVVKEKFIQHQRELASTTVNYAELVYGLKKRDNKKYLPQVEIIFENIKVYEFDKKSAKMFGILKADMQKRGVVVADMDLMIASITIANGEELISNNIGHFSKIEILDVCSWV
ncbi:PIN domain-containing protein [Sulfurovum sp. bin170]|uniref:PIN domain-containing protein n=1 Tax=Sulfurovum sp. bin170 TaxID=2695268 RepID=UPI0021061B8E|nr:PIN domain-containing protein [Sulfurovum sp. bin170]